MSEKTFWKLAVAAAVLLVLSVIVGSTDRSPTFEFKPGYPLVTNLDPSKVDTIEIKAGDEETLLKQVADGSFVVSDLHNYPASVAKISGLIGDVLKIRCREKIGDDPDGHADLKVLAPSQDTVGVRFLDRDGVPILGVLLSQVNAGAQYIDGGQSSQYARIEGENTVYKVDGVVHLGTTGLRYVDTSVLGIEFNDCEKVRVTPSEGAAYLLSKPEEGDTVIDTLPEGMRKKDYLADEVLTASYGVELTALAPLSELADAKFTTSYVATSRGKVQYHLEFAKHGEGEGEWWMRCKAVYVGPESLSKDAPAEEIEVAATAVGEVERFNALHQGWAYRAADWKVERMTRPLAELIEPIAEETEGSAEGQTPNGELPPK